MIEKPWEKKNDLLKQHREGKISLEELQKECAYWFVDCIEEMKPRPEPTRPRDFEEYASMPFEKRAKISSEFWQQPQIKGYLEIREQIKNENNANMFWIKEHIKHIPEEDFVSRNALRNKLTEFELKDYA